MTTVSLTLVVTLILRSLRRQDAEHEFARWFRVPLGHELVFREGWWIVEIGREMPTTSDAP
jgi:hypothetical protein